MKMSNKARTEWVAPKEKFYVSDPAIMKVAGVDVALFDPHDLIAYKKELDGDHQLIDIKAVQWYIQQHDKR